MDFVRTKILDVILISPEVFGDDRGFFLETFREDKFSEFGIGPKFVQDNHSGSQRGVLRGLHYQIRQPQGKLVRAISGEIFDVAVDIRKSSKTFGRWVGAVLSAKNKNQLWLPPGFAHGFFVLSDWAEVVYKATDYYAPEFERSILWNDPDINIVWPNITEQSPIVSVKDSKACLFKIAEYFQ
jgi:dTDP-4-dehydrorhamnose 3,5-epimerase